MQSVCYLVNVVYICLMLTALSIRLFFNVLFWEEFIIVWVEINTLPSRMLYHHALVVSIWVYKCLCLYRFAFLAFLSFFLNLYSILTDTNTCYVLELKIYLKRIWLLSMNRKWNENMNTFLYHVLHIFILICLYFKLQ